MVRLLALLLLPVAANALSLAPPPQGCEDGQSSLPACVAYWESANKALENWNRMNNIPPVTTTTVLSGTTLPLEHPWSVEPSPTSPIQMESHTIGQRPLECGSQGDQEACKKATEENMRGAAAFACKQRSTAEAEAIPLQECIERALLTPEQRRQKGITSTVRLLEM